MDPTVRVLECNECLQGLHAQRRRSRPVFLGHVSGATSFICAPSCHRSVTAVNIVVTTCTSCRPSAWRSETARACLPFPRSRRTRVDVGLLDDLPDHLLLNRLSRLALDLQLLHDLDPCR